MTALLLPFARRLSDHQLVSPGEVPRGRACDCVCPGCEHPVLARQGTEREWHFAHTRGQACAEGYGVSIHELAKQLIRERKELLLPALEAVVSGSDVTGRFLEERELLFDGKTVVLDECRTRQARDEVTADVSGTLKGREILVEVTVFHRLMPEKRRRLVDTGLASFQIDLGAFKTVQATRQRLENAIFREPGNRSWIHHPRLEAAKARLQLKLDARLAEARAQWEADEARRKEQAAQRAKEREAKSPPIPYLSWDTAPILPYGWDDDFDDEPPVPPGTIWRASFPSAESVSAAQRALAQRTGIPIDRVRAVTGTITERGELAPFSVGELATRWAGELEVGEDEVLRYFSEADYVLP
jgi:hypothetical protein